MHWVDQFLQTVVLQWGPALLQGAVVTLQISLGAFAMGLVVGLLVAIAKLSGVRALVVGANVYITVCRSVPELLLILLLFYAGSDLVNALMDWLGREPVEINGFISGMVVLGIVQGAYASEIIRGAILAIPPGHFEAARAFGCSQSLIVRRILVPAMMPSVGWRDVPGHHLAVQPGGGACRRPLSPLDAFALAVPGASHGL
jgi:polar amino acid transport system permease protein